ncbi:hypothetical protein U1Q18_005536 [Sarracenia purpurea var. burkii]
MQMLYLDDWDLIDRDDSRSLSGAIEALEARSLQVPVGGGARADTQSVKHAICSAVNVMQAMASSICTSLTKVDEVNSLLSELANVTSKECALLDQCKDLLSSLTAIQVMRGISSLKSKEPFTLLLFLNWFFFVLTYCHLWLEET